MQSRSNRREISEDLSRAGVLRAPDLLIDGQGSEVERLGVAVTGLSVVEQTEIVEADRRFSSRRSRSVPANPIIA